MSNYTQILYQLVFSTKHRAKTLVKQDRDTLYKYIGGVLTNQKCASYCIGGIEDHIHIAFGLHPTIALSNLVKDIKLSATAFIREQKIFPDFGGWQEGYGAFTYGIEAKEELVKYVMNQEEHHKMQDSKEELRGLLEKFGIEINEKYFE